MAVGDRDLTVVAASERRLRFLDELAQSTQALASADEVMTTTARLLGQHLGASRCAYALVEADQDHFDLVGDYNDGVPSIVGRYAFTDFGPVVTRLMREGIAYVNDDVDTDPRTQAGELAAYRATHIQAVICVPLHKAGRFVAAMAVHQAAPRHWTAEEIELVKLVVARCWESLERQRAARALADAHERLSLAMDAGDLGDWIWDAASDDIAFSDRAAQIYGVEPGRLHKRQELRSLLHPDDEPAAREAARISTAEKDVYRVQYRIRVPGGGWRWALVQGKPRFDEHGALAGMVGIVQDVQQLRAAQESARVEAAMLDTLNKTGAALAAQLDLDALLQMATDAATQLTSAQFGAFFYNGRDERGEALLLYTLSGAPKSAFENFGHPRPTALFGPTFRGDPPIRSDDIRQDPRYGQWGPHHGMPAGHLPVVSYLAVPVVSRGGEVIGGLFFGHDRAGVFDERSERLAVGIAAQAAVAIDNARMYADAQRAAEERRGLLESERAARRHAERADATKDEFLSTLSHELRTPLGAILGWAQVLLRKLGPAADEDVRKGVEVIERNSRAQAQLIDDLLDMSRIQSGKLRLDVQPIAPIGFIEAAIETVRPALDAGGVRLETVLDPAAGPVQGDAGRLQQVLWNLLSNAVKFTPRGGRIQVTLARVDSRVEIAVSDTGRGIAPEFLPHLFERFRQADGSTTRRFGGLGLGLSIARNLVELHGGAIEARSDGEGRGATFIVQLPLALARSNAEGGGQHPAVPAKGAPVYGSDELRGLVVLVVDDEADSRELLRHVLASAGARVSVAGGALAALDAIASECPDVLVSDIGMPEIDGYELLRRIRQLHPGCGGSLPAIALTAFARSEDRVRALRAGFAVHVSKPVEPGEIVATVASVAGRPGGRQPPAAG